MLEAFLADTRGEYLERARALAEVSARHDARDLAAFVLFTPRQTYERAVIEWRTWMRTREVRGSLWRMRGEYIKSLPQGSFLDRGARESGPSWTERLEVCVSGLGPAKAPFLCSILRPLDWDIPVCLDVWMVRKGYTQDSIRANARTLEVPPFVYQWAVWDWIRAAGIDNQIPFLVQPTDIAKDLTL